MPVVLKNNASNSLAAAITSTDTGIVVRNGNLFPALAAGQYFYATITGADGSQEIVKVTARSGNGMTIVRAQEGTFALPFQLDSRFEMRITAATIADILAEDDLAATVTIADAGGYYTGGTVEAALQEVGSILTTVPVARGGTAATTADNALVNLAAQKKFAQVRKDVATLLADTTITYTAGTVNSVATGDVVQTAAEGFSYSVAASGASDHHVTTAGGVKLYVLPVAAGYDVRAFGAVGDGVANDTAAIVAADAAAAEAGLSVVVPRGMAFGLTSLTATASLIGGGTLKRLSGTLDFITTGAQRLHFDVVLDCQTIGQHALAIRHDFTTTADTFRAQNVGHTGVDLLDAEFCTIRGEMRGCVQMGVYALAGAKDVRGLVIDVRVDNEALGASNLNGGVKVFGSASFAMVEPRITANVRLVESASVNTNQVCIETHTNCIVPRVSGETWGGYIGCTVNNSPCAQVNVVSRGAKNIGIESDNSPRSVLRGAVYPGGTVTPLYGVQFSGGDHGAVSEVSVADVLSSDTSSACAYINLSNGVTIRGPMSRTGGRYILRIRGSADAKIESKCQGTPEWLVLVDVSVGSCNGLFFDGAEFPSSTYGIQCTGVLSNVVFGDGTVFRNSNTLFTGSPTLSGVMISPRARIQTTGIASAATYLEVLDFKQGSASLIRAHGSNSPESVVTAAVGSQFLRTNGGAGTTLYVKESGTGNTGWVAK